MKKKLCTVCYKQENVDYCTCWLLLSQSLCALMSCVYISIANASNIYWLGSSQPMCTYSVKMYSPLCIWCICFFSHSLAQLQERFFSREQCMYQGYCSHSAVRIWSLVRDLSRPGRVRAHAVLCSGTRSSQPDRSAYTSAMEYGRSSQPGRSFTHAYKCMQLEPGRRGRANKRRKATHRMFAAHAWSIKCRRKEKLIAQFGGKLRDERFEPN